MVRVCLSFVPADGAATVGVETIDLPAAPEVGDSILIRRPPASTGYEAFIVKRRWWMIDVASQINPETATHDKAGRLCVECQYARHAQRERMTEQHAQACDECEARGMAIPDLENQPY